MQISKNAYVISFLLIVITALKSVAFAIANEQNPVHTVVVNTLSSMKNVLMKHSTQKDIELKINQGIKAGANGFKITYNPHYPTIKDMGWTVVDSKGREPFRVYFSFDDNKAKDGRYISGDIIDKSNDGTAQTLYLLHKDAMASNYKQIKNDQFDIGNNCNATLKLKKYPKSRYEREAFSNIIIEVMCR